MDAPLAPRLRQGVVHLLSGSLFGRAISFGINLLLSRVLGPSALGLFTLVLTTAQTFEITAQGGVDYGISCALTGKDAAESVEKRQNIAAAALRFVGITTVLLAMGLWIWVMPFKGLLPNDLVNSRALISLGLVSVAVLESLGSLPWVLFLILGQTKLVALRQGVFAPSRLLAALLGGWFFAAPGALAGYALLSAAQCLWLRQRCQSILHLVKRQSISLKEIGHLVKTGLPLYLTNAVAGLVFLPLLADVARTAGVSDVGYLRIGQMVVQLFTLLPGALAPLLFLKLRQAPTDQDQMRTSEPSLRLIWCLGLLALLGYLLLDRTLVLWLFGEAFMPSIQPTRVLVLCAVLDSANQVLHTPLLASRRTGLFSLSQNLGAISAAALGMKLIPSLGLQGYLIAKFGFSLIPVLIYSVDAWWKLPSRTLLPGLILATAAVTPLCWSSTPTHQIDVVLISCSIVLIIYCAWPLRNLINKAV